LFLLFVWEIPTLLCRAFCSPKCRWHHRRVEEVSDWWSKRRRIRRSVAETLVPWATEVHRRERERESSCETMRTSLDLMNSRGFCNLDSVRAWGASKFRTSGWVQEEEEEREKSAMSVSAHVLLLRMLRHFGFF